MPHVWKRFDNLTNEINYVPIERERSRTKPPREKANDQGGNPTTRNEGDVQTREEPTKHKGEGRCQQSSSKP